MSSDCRCFEFSVGITSYHVYQKNWNLKVSKLLLWFDENRNQCDVFSY